MIRLLWTASAEVRYFLRRCMPSNIVLDLIRGRKGLKWGVPAMLLAGPYLAIAFWCTTVTEHGGPGWLHLVVLLCIWNASQDAGHRPGERHSPREGSRTGAPDQESGRKWYSRPIPSARTHTKRPLTCDR